jgi:hypothetical protein
MIGPLWVAANNRKTYEITMGGTMLSLTMALAYLIGNSLGIILGSLT